MTSERKRPARDYVRNANQEGGKFFIPEHNLLFAILERAAIDYHSANRLVSSRARIWLESKSNKSWSYLWCLDHLNLIDQSIEILKEIKLKEYHKTRLGNVRVKAENDRS